MRKTNLSGYIEEQPDRDDLPEGWVEVELGDHLYIAGRIGWRGLKADEYTPSGPIFLSVPNLNNGDDVDFSSVNHISVARYDESPEIHLRVGDTLLVKDGAGIGKLGYVRQLPSKATINSSLLLIRPIDALLNPLYVFHYLKGPRLQEIARRRITGSATPHLFQRDIKLFRILVPPLQEQLRIVLKAQALSAQVENASARLAKIPVILKRFRQAVLAAACSGRLTAEWRDLHPQLEPASDLLLKINQLRSGAPGRKQKASSIGASGFTDLDLPDTWIWATIQQVAEVKGGIQKQPKRAPKNNAYPYLRVANVLRDKLDLSEVHRMELFEGELETYRLQFGDLLIVEGNGSLNEIGRSALWTGAIENCVHQNHIIRVRACLCSPDYLNIYWNSPVGRANVAEVAVTTSGLYSLSTAKVAAISVALPSLEEQQEIVRRVEALFKLADAIEKRVAVATARADKLTQAILAKAFRGELVPTEAELARREGRSYEPASALLNRIKAERERSTPPKKSGRSRNAVVHGQR